MRVRVTRWRISADIFLFCFILVEMGKGEENLVIVTEDYSVASCPSSSSL
jgi:hypothetical protein